MTRELPGWAVGAVPKVLAGELSVDEVVPYGAPVDQVYSFFIHLTQAMVDEHRAWQAEREDLLGTLARVVHNLAPPDDQRLEDLSHA